MLAFIVVTRLWQKAKKSKPTKCQKIKKIAPFVKMYALTRESKKKTAPRVFVVLRVVIRE